MQNDRSNPVERPEGDDHARRYAPATAISKDKIVRLSERCFKAIFTELVAAGVNRTDAFMIAKDAGDAAGNSLLRDLPTNGVEIVD